VSARPFDRSLDSTEGREKGAYRLRKLNPRYDARMLAMNRSLAPGFKPLFSRPWLQSLAHLVRLPELDRIDGGLHSSPAGSRTGWIHTDLCSGWFDESEGAPPPFPRREKVDYFTGAAKSEDARPMEYVRGATMIYYLCNDDWKPGDGGETGLYGSSKVGSRAPCYLLPPLNNTALVFECSPHSYHRFIANPGRERNSIILWLHTTVGKAESMWGDGINRRKAP
jgi:hypothetical protein